jgi:signal transduction histidine kinase
MGPDCLFELVQDEHLRERRRIARDLHDRLGERLSVALRQLELLEIAPGEGLPGATPRSVIAREALVDAMQRLRAVISDLRQDPVINLEMALSQYIDSAGSSAEARLRVSGDQAWVPPAVSDEAFLIIREAIRNALTHGAAKVLLVTISLAPHELRASVEDNGTGFALATGTWSSPAGNGIASMNERAELLGGRLTITSVTGEGTRVELVVPLPGRSGENGHTQVSSS